jgi:hypothetical protein
VTGSNIGFFENYSYCDAEQEPSHQAYHKENGTEKLESKGFLPYYQTFKDII